MFYSGWVGRGAIAPATYFFNLAKLGLDEKIAHVSGPIIEAIDKVEMEIGLKKNYARFRKEN